MAGHLKGMRTASYRALARASIAALSALLFGFASVNSANASDPLVEVMGKTFVRQLPSGWLSVKGGWEYVNIADCYLGHANCFGNNPSGEYGSPTLPTPNGLSPVLQLTPNEALVIFLRTPPKMRYFGFTQYLFSRPGQTYPLFASVSDSLNLKEFSALDSQTPGAGVFDKYAVIVWTADLNAYNSIVKTLAKQGIASDRINFIPIPISLPLFMGNGLVYDSFNLLMRTAIPDVRSRLDSYLASMPFYVVKAGPATRTPVNAAPTIGYANRTSGIVEDPALRISLTKMIANIKDHYAAQFAFTDLKIGITDITGWDCIKRNMTCNADTYDALYSRSTTVQVARTNDVVIVAGVNHQKTNKALYLNLTIADAARSTGIVAIDDMVLTTESALYHAGITSPNDPRIQSYQNLYAYAVSYDCSGLQFCLQIPPPTPENPVGLAPGAPFVIAGRSYVEPHTLVRPSLQEVVMHRVFLGTHK